MVRRDSMRKPKDPGLRQPKPSSKARGEPTSVASSAKMSPRAGWQWMLAGPLALAALWWSTRGAPLGFPVADDYAFLYRLQFQRPLDFLDSMGATFYWRPVSRQLYFLAMGKPLLHALWIVPAAHAVLFLALF